jgi:hypothetical protein
MQQEILIYHSWFRLLLVSLRALILFALGFAAFRGFGIALLTGHFHWKVHVVQAAVFVTFGFLAMAISAPYLLYGMWRLIVRKPCIVISDRGIEDNASPMSVGFVSWSEIEDVRIVEVAIRLSKLQFLCMHVVDRDALIRRLPFPKRLVRRLIKGSPVNIPRSTLPMNLERLKELIESRRPTAKPAT